MNKSTKMWLDVVWFFVAFGFVSIVCLYATIGIFAVVNKVSVAEVQQGVQMAQPIFVKGVVIPATIAMQLVLIIFFVWRKWAKPITLVWPQKNNSLWGFAVVLALALVVPLQLVYDWVGVELAPEMDNLYTNILKNPAGVISIVILAPIAEEIVFRGAILNTLLKILSNKTPWIAICISALLFCSIHGNRAQGLNAFILGLIIGWMFYKTGSIALGFVFHLANNAIATILTYIFPQQVEDITHVFFNDSVALTIIVTIACLAVAVWCVVKINNNVNSNKNKMSIPQ